ncbi:MAG: hypothetical protein ACFFB5_23335 [Promethearchaeota archaeon]
MEKKREIDLIEHFGLKKLKTLIEERNRLIEKSKEIYPLIQQRREKAREWLIKQGIIGDREAKRWRIEEKKRIFGLKSNPGPTGQVYMRVNQPTIDEMIHKVQNIEDYIQGNIPPPSPELYIQPAWTGFIDGPKLSWHLEGDHQPNITDWDDAPPDFKWIVKPEADQVTTASAEMNMYLIGGHDGWNRCSFYLLVQAMWYPRYRGRFKAHYHFGGAESEYYDGGCHGDGELFWPEEAHFWADIYIGVMYDYYDNNWILLEEKHRNIANRHESQDYNRLGQLPYYFKLDHWLATREYPIPQDGRVSVFSAIRFLLEAEDEECSSSVGFSGDHPLLIRPVITGAEFE